MIPAVSPSDEKPHSFWTNDGDGAEFSHLEFYAAADTYAQNLLRHRCERPIEHPNSLALSRCHTRLADKCRGCADLYRGDWRRIAYSGVFDSDGDSVAGHDFYFMTLTDESHGRTHYVPWSWKNNRPGSWDRNGCTACWAVYGEKAWHHPERDKFKRGTPLTEDAIDAYDVEGAIGFNMYSYEAVKTMIKRARNRWGADVAVFGVKEPQSRLSTHYHLTWRFPVDSAPRDAEELRAIIDGCRVADCETGQVYSFGEQTDVQSVEDYTNKHGHKGLAAVLGYVLKALNYSLVTATGVDLKGKEDRPFYDGGSIDEQLRRRFVGKLTETARTKRCPQCPVSGPEECGSPRHENVGVSQRPFVKTNNWSFQGLTRVGLKEKRKLYQQSRVADRLSTQTVRKSVLERNIEVRDAAEFLHLYRNTPVAEHGQMLHTLRARSRAAERTRARAP